jgi:hypothetical protein
MLPIAARCLLFAIPILPAGSCALPHGPDQRMKSLNVVSFGVVSGLHRENARTGFHFAAFNAGTSRWGSYASMRMDSVVGLDLLSNEASDSDNLHHDEHWDNYQGAFVFNMGGLFRPTHTLGFYVGLGYGNFYDRRIETRNGEDTAVLRTLYWGENLQSGILWTPNADSGIDFGYETFDDSWHLAFTMSPRYL